MAEIDRRTLIRGMLYCAAFTAAGGAAITTPELARAVPLAADKAGPAEVDDVLNKEAAPDNDDIVEIDDLSELPEHAQQAQYWRRRRRRWWRRRRRVRCFWRRGRRVCVRRW
jgi:hypothetical protein